MSVKVCKFGGTSMADAAAINRVADIIFSESERAYVVVSAPGKRFSGDEKVTDLLYASCEEAKQSGHCAHHFARIRERYLSIVKDLKLDIDFETILNETERRICELKDVDFAASRGEYLNAILVAKRLNFTFVDAAELVKFNEKGQFDSEYTNDICSKRLAKVKNAVIPGFYGTKPDGSIKTFSRGGSDITGSIVARAVEASVYENWTDVDGFMVADPRVVENPKVIDMLTYRELRELSYMGASVLHSEAIFPVRFSNIPVNIRNTFKPEQKGTMIVPDSVDYMPKGVITGIAGHRGFAVLLIEKSMMNAELGFGRRVLSVLEHYGIPFEHMPSGIDTLSLIVSANEIHGKIKEVTDQIKETVNADSVTLTEGLTLVALVGHGMCKKVGTASKLFHAIAEAGINIRMIDQGSSEMNIIIGVDDADYEGTVRAIYKEFMKNEDK